MLGDPDLVLVPGGGWNDKRRPGRALEARARRDHRRCCASATRPAAASARSARARCCSPRPASSTGRRATTHHTSHEDLETYGVDVRRGRALRRRGRHHHRRRHHRRASTWRCTSSSRRSAPRPPRPAPPRSNGTARPCDPATARVRRTGMATPRKRSSAAHASWNAGDLEGYLKLYDDAIQPPRLHPGADGQGPPCAASTRRSSPPSAPRRRSSSTRCCGTARHGDDPLHDVRHPRRRVHGRPPTQDGDRPTRHHDPALRGRHRSSSAGRRPTCSACSSSSAPCPRRPRP